jgi:hypothetical protein
MSERDFLGDGERLAGDGLVTVGNKSNKKQFQHSGRSRYEPTSCTIIPIGSQDGCFGASLAFGDLSLIVAGEQKFAPAHRPSRS